MDKDDEGTRDCPFQVEINGIYDSCDCGGENYAECCVDI